MEPKNMRQSNPSAAHAQLHAFIRLTPKSATTAQGMGIPSSPLLLLALGFIDSPMC
jgi:hypothetical protein